MRFLDFHSLGLFQILKPIPVISQCFTSHTLWAEPQSKLYQLAVSKGVVALHYVKIPRKQNGHHKLLYYFPTKTTDKRLVRGIPEFTFVGAIVKETSLGT